MDPSQRHNRAIRLLEEKGHSVGLADSNSALVDNQRYSLTTLISFVEEQYPEEWRAVERDYNEKLRK